MPGCTCLKHTPAPKKKCPEGCTCGKHNKQRRINWDDPEVRKTYNRDMARKIRTANPELSREAARRWQERNPYYVKYRITRADWEKMFADQQGCCYLCGGGFDLENRKAIHIDHDHECCPSGRDGPSCGKCIRGLACRTCNQGIGAFMDDPDLMERAAKALREANSRVRNN